MVNGPAGNEVSSASAFNSDSTCCLILASKAPAVLDHFVLCDDSGVYLRDSPIAASREPRWSREVAREFFYVQGNAIRIFDTDGGTSGDVHVFDEYVSISGKGEGDWSKLDALALCGLRLDGVEEIFTFSLENGKGRVFTSTKPIDGLKIDSKNRPIVSRVDGIFVLEPKPEPWRKLVPVNGHAAVTDYHGRPQLLWCSNAESSPEHPWQNSCIMVDIETLERRVLANFGKLNFAMHISACDKGCLISVFDPMNILPAQLWWSDYEAPAVLLYEFRTIIKAERKSSDHPKASLARDGSRAVFCVGTDDSIQAWMVKLGADTPTNLGGEFIDYAPYAHKSEFAIVPQSKCPTCGSTVAGIAERKL